MDVALDLASLLVLGGDQALTRRLQVLDQRHVAQCEPRLCGQVLDEFLPCRVEPVVRRHLHRERAKRFSVVADLDGVLRRFGRVRRGIGGDGDAPQDPVGSKPHRRTVRAGPAAQHLRHAVEHVVGRVRLADAVGEPGEHLVGRCSLPVGDPVGEVPDASEDRLERDRDDRRRDDRQSEVVLPSCADERADPDHDRDVDHGDERRERCVDDRLRDHGVDVVEPILQDRDTRGDRDQRDHRTRDRVDPRVVAVLERQDEPGEHDAACEVSHFS